MILVGQMDSPFVRRVAVSMNIQGVAFERQVISVYADADAVRAVNPLGKVPALILDDGETLFDSQMILDHLDELAGSERALTPPAGPQRRAVLRCCAVALGLAEKVVGLNFETKQRDPDTIDSGVIQRLETQVVSALNWLEAQHPDPWLCGPAMTQADITATASLTHLFNRRGELFPDGTYPALAALRDRCEKLPPFQASPFADE
jgi:glutathione S-transferase